MYSFCIKIILALISIFVQWHHIRKLDDFLWFGVILYYRVNLQGHFDLNSKWKREYFFSKFCCCHCCCSISFKSAIARVWLSKEMYYSGFLWEMGSSTEQHFGTIRVSSTSSMQGTIIYDFKEDSLSPKGLILGQYNHYERDCFCC